MVLVVENKSDYRALVCVANSAIPFFDAEPVLVSPAGEEKWLRTETEFVVIMTRHGWHACQIPPDGYVRIGTKNIYVMPNGKGEHVNVSPYYTWFDNTNISFRKAGFSFSMKDVREICMMEHVNTKKEDKSGEFEFQCEGKSFGRECIASES